MITYYFNDNTNENGHHAIHTRDCPYLSNRKIEIGIYKDARDAICAAQKGLPDKKYNNCCFCCCEHLSS